MRNKNQNRKTMNMRTKNRKKIMRTKTKEMSRNEEEMSTKRIV